MPSVNMSEFEELRRNPYSVEVEIDASKVSGTQQNIPLMLETPNSSNSELNVVGFGDNGVQLPIEIEGTANDKNWVHLANTVQSIINQRMKVFYGGTCGKPAVDSTYGSEAVYMAGYDVVYNMAQAPASLVDSTSNDRNITTVVGDPSEIEGDYGKGIAFDSNDGVKSSSCGNIGTGDFAATIVFSAPSPTDTYLFSNRDPALIDQFALRIIVATGYNDFITYDGASQSAIATTTATDDGNEHTMTVRRVGTSMKIYIDGVERADATLAVRNIDTTTQYAIAYNGTIGYSNSNIFLARNYIGTMSVNYILTTHKNLNNPTASGTDPFYKSITKELNYTQSLKSFGRVG